MFDIKSMKPEQIGFVVKNLEESIARYETLLGVGPFVVRRFIPDYYELDGVSGTLCLKLAKCQWGEVELELIEAANDNPGSLEFLEQHGEGVQHFGYYVEDYEACLTYFQEQGIKMIHCAEWNHPERGHMRAAYFDTVELLGVLTEIMEK